MARQRIHIGTSGWSYDHWQGIFYPEGLAANQRLAYYQMANYMSTKQAICAYVASQAFPMLKRGIRINAICPGPTDTPLAQANKEVWLAFGTDYRKEVGVEASTPLEQAYPLLFLCSDAAAAINGITLISDSGYMMSGITESFPSATMMARVLMGRT